MYQYADIRNHPAIFIAFQNTVAVTQMESVPKQRCEG